MSIGTDGKPARVCQHINSREPKPVNSKSGFDNWKGSVYTVISVYSVSHQMKTRICFNPDC